MSTTKHVLAATNFFWDWTDISAITANDDWSGVPSIVGYRGDNVVGSAGQNPQGATGDGTIVVDVNANLNSGSPPTNTPNSFGTGGVSEFHLADPVVALAGSGTADAPHLVVYLDATGRENIVFSYRARDLETGADTGVAQVAVQYRVGGTGLWTDVPTGYISAATPTGATAGPDIVKTVNMPSAVNGASDLRIRVITTDASNTDQWVGIDDIGVTSTAIPPGPGILSIADATVAEGNAGTTPIIFTVSRTAGDDGAATVAWNVTFTGGTAVAHSTDFAPGQLFSGTLNWADGDAASKTITLLVQGDAVVEPSEKFTVTLSNATGGVSVSDATALGTITNDDSGPVPIFQIQGSTHTSPWTGETVTTTGIVTAVDSNGYYLQDANGDGNDATSDAIFVFTGGTPTVTIGGTPEPILIGDFLTVTGTVTEFQASAAGLTITEIINSTAVRGPSGNSPPNAVVIGTGGRMPPTENYENDNFTSFDPATDALDFYESLEGMRVTIDNPLVVAETNNFGETFVVASGGAGATGVNARDGITVSEGDFNPERIQIDDDANLGPAYDPDHSQGDELGDVTGILNYAFNFYEVLVTGPVTVTNDVDLGQETTALDGDSTHLTVATYNVENLDPTDAQSKFDAIAGQIVNNLSAPDIVGLQEVQDADGAGTGTDYSGQATADKLIAAIVAAGGPTYQYVEIAPTSNSTSNGESNGNIRNGYLYNPARVTYVPGSEELVPGAVASGARYPLAVDFLFNGETVTVINVHFTSRGGSEPLMGDSQPPANANDSARLTQAQAVRAYIDALAAGNPELNIVTLGDFNSYYFEAPLEALQAGGAMNNLFLLLPEEERYSYMFEGNLQPFDNILVSPNLDLSSEFDAVHLNAEQPAGLAKPTDHDPTLARIQIRANDLISGTPGDDDRSSGAGNDLFYLQEGGSDQASGGAGHDAFLFGATLDSTDSVDGGEGKDQLGLQGNYGAPGSPFTLGADHLVNVETLALLSGSDTRFGDPGTNLYDYHLAAVDSNVPDGGLLHVNFNTLQTGEDVSFDGSGELDGSLFFFAGLGTDWLRGGQADDAFLFGTGASGAIFTADDRVEGNGGVDQLGLRGNYTIVFQDDTMVEVETLALLSGKDTRAGAAGPDYHYDITTHDDNVAAGQRLKVNAQTLRPGEEVVFDGSAETDGWFRIVSGQCNDTLTGGDGDDWFYGNLGFDLLTGGDGSDTFFYRSAAESSSLDFDTFTDFVYNVDVIDLPSSNDNFAFVTEGRLDIADFDADLAAAVDALLQPNWAVFFTPDEGDFAGRVFVVAEANGVAGYQAGADYVFEMPVAPPGVVHDFFH